jgi:hypothetical protein
MEINIDMSNPVYDKLSEIVYKTYPTACILWINKIKNDILLEKYNNTKGKLIELHGESGVKEMQLYHGSLQTHIQNICNIGFKAEYNTISAFGKGTYFSADASYSKTYTRPKKDQISYLIMANVLVGKTGLAAGNKSDLDNYVNVEKNPTIYVCPKDDYAYPTYIIAFYPFAD